MPTIQACGLDRKQNKIVMEASPENTAVLYEELVRSMYDSGSADLISNGKPEHAIVLYRLFFEKATTRVSILCRNLSEKVFADERILTSAQEAVKRGVFISVIVQDAEVKPSKFLDWLIQESKKSGKVFLTKLDGKGRFSQLSANFAFMDYRAFRLESDRDTISAMASMNLPGVVEKLASLFDSVRGRQIATRLHAAPA